MAERLRREREREARYRDYKQEVRNYEVDKEISYYEQVTGKRDATYLNGFVTVGARRLRLAAFHAYVRQIEAGEHEKSFTKKVDN